VHVEQLDLSQVKRIDFEIIIYLKEAHPDLYRTLRRAVKSRHKASPDTGINLAAQLGEDVNADILEVAEVGAGPEGHRTP